MTLRAQAQSSPLSQPQFTLELRHRVVLYPNFSSLWEPRSRAVFYPKLGSGWYHGRGDRKEVRKAVNTRTHSTGMTCTWPTFLQGDRNSSIGGGGGCPCLSRWPYTPVHMGNANGLHGSLVKRIKRGMWWEVLGEAGSSGVYRFKTVFLKNKLKMLYKNQRREVWPFFVNARIIHC